MTERAFFEQRTHSPAKLGLVILLHGMAIGALLLAKGPQVDPSAFAPTKVEFIPIEPDPPPEPQPQPRPRETPAPPQHRSVIDRVPPVIDLPSPAPPTHWDPVPVPTLDRTPPGPLPVPEPRRAEPLPPPPPPVRTEADIDPRFLGDLQPPYPASEERAGLEGSVALRVTIGADGRVKAAERISATSDAFWRSTQRQALSRWRFRPATVDGRPVESRKVMTVHFRLD